MNTEKIKYSLKKVRDFILCCKKTIYHVEDILDDYKPEEKYNPIVYDR